jgi:hypothetical protein
MIAGFLKRFVKRFVKMCAVEIDSFYRRLSYRCYLRRRGGETPLPEYRPISCFKRIHQDRQLDAVL